MGLLVESILNITNFMLLMICINMILLTDHWIMYIIAINRYSKVSLYLGYSVIRWTEVPLYTLY